MIWISTAKACCGISTCACFIAPIGELNDLWSPGAGQAGLVNINVADVIKIVGKYQKARTNFFMGMKSVIISLANVLDAIYFSPLAGSFQNTLGSAIESWIFYVSFTDPVSFMVLYAKRLLIVKDCN